MNCRQVQFKTLSKLGHYKGPVKMLSRGSGDQKRYHQREGFCLGLEELENVAKLRGIAGKRSQKKMRTVFSGE